MSNWLNYLENDHAKEERILRVQNVCGAVLFHTHAQLTGYFIYSHDIFSLLLELNMFGASDCVIPQDGATDPQSERLTESALMLLINPVHSFKEQDLNKVCAYVDLYDKVVNPEGRYVYGSCTVVFNSLRIQVL